MNQRVLACHALKSLAALCIPTSRRFDVIRTVLPASKGDDNDGSPIDGQGRHHPWVRVSDGLRCMALRQPCQRRRCPRARQLILVGPVAPVRGRHFCLHPGLGAGQVGEAERPPELPFASGCQQAEAFNALQAVTSADSEHEVHMFVLEGDLLVRTQLVPGGQTPTAIENDNGVCHAFTPLEGGLS